MRLTALSRAFICALALVTGASAMAQESIPVGEVFAGRNWVVNVYQDDDGALSCISEVTSELATLAIWAYPTGEVYLNLDSEEWGFDPASETFELEIDELGAWSFGSTEIDGSSIFVELTGEKAASDFLTEVAGGNVAYLRNPAGELLAEPFSLEGSDEAILSQVGCVEGLAEVK